MAALLAALGDSEGLASSSADAMVELIASDSSRGEPADGNQVHLRSLPLFGPLLVVSLVSASSPLRSVPMPCAFPQPVLCPLNFRIP